MLQVLAHLHKLSFLFTNITHFSFFNLENCCSLIELNEDPSYSCCKWSLRIFLMTCQKTLVISQICPKNNNPHPPYFFFNKVRLWYFAKRGLFFSMDPYLYFQSPNRWSELFNMTFVWKFTLRPNFKFCRIFYYFYRGRKSLDCLNFVNKDIDSKHRPFCSLQSTIVSLLFMSRTMALLITPKPIGWFQMTNLNC